jgi:FtsX-like permease family
MANSVRQRTHEIGIRMALGAGSGDVLRLVIWHGLLLVGIGAVIGLLVAMALTGLLASFLWGVTATDAATFALVILGAAHLNNNLELDHRAIKRRVMRAREPDPLTGLANAAWLRGSAYDPKGPSAVVTKRGCGWAGAVHPRQLKAA